MGIEHETLPRTKHVLTGFQVRTEPRITRGTDFDYTTEPSSKNRLTTERAKELTASGMFSHTYTNGGVHTLIGVVYSHEGTGTRVISMEHYVESGMHNQLFFTVTERIEGAA